MLSREGLGHAVRVFERGLELLAAVMLAAMMFLTFFDVIGRYVLSAPVPAAFELTELAMGMLIFATIPLVTLRDRHVTIDLVAGWFAGIAERVRGTMVALFSAVVLAGFAWRLVINAQNAREAGYSTQSLDLPEWWFPLIMAGFSALAALIALILAGLRAAGATRSASSGGPV